MGAVDYEAVQRDLTLLMTDSQVLVIITVMMMMVMTMMVILMIRLEPFYVITYRHIIWSLSSSSLP